MKNIFALLFTVCVMLSVSSVKAHENASVTALSKQASTPVLNAVKAEVIANNLVAIPVPTMRWYWWSYKIVSPYVMPAPLTPGCSFTRVVYHPPCL